MPRGVVFELRDHLGDVGDRSATYDQVRVINTDIGMLDHDITYFFFRCLVEQPPQTLLDTGRCQRGLASRCNEEEVIPDTVLPLAVSLDGVPWDYAHMFAHD